MKADWTVKDAHLHLCEHGTQVLHLDLDFHSNGRRGRSSLAYHLSDLLDLPGEVKENLSHLIDVHISSEAQALEALGDPAALKGLSGHVESAEELLSKHPGGKGEEHPPTHTCEAEGPGMLRL